MDALDDFIKAFEALPAPNFGLPPPVPSSPGGGNNPAASPPPSPSVAKPQPQPLQGTTALKPRFPPPAGASGPVSPPSYQSPTTKPQPQRGVITNGGAPIPSTPMIPQAKPVPGPGAGAKVASPPGSGRSHPVLKPASPHKEEAPPLPPREASSESVPLKAPLFDLLRQRGFERPILLSLDPASKFVCQTVCKEWRKILLAARLNKTTPRGSTQKARALAGAEIFTAELAKLGRADLLRWAVKSEGCPFGPEACGNIAAEHGQLEVMKFCRDMGWKWDAKTCHLAATGGQLEALKFAKAGGCAWDQRAVVSAVMNGHAETAKWAVSNGCPSMWERDFWKDCAKREEQTGIPVGVALKGSGVPPERAAGAWHVAAKEGDLQVMNFLLLHWEDDCTAAYWSRNTTAYAAGKGRMDILQWLRARDCPWDEETCRAAVKHDHFDILQWAHDNGCPWGPSACGAAAAKGRLDMLKWLRAQGCPWDETTLTRSTRRGRKEVQEWAIANGAPTVSKRKSADILSSFLEEVDKKEHAKEKTTAAPVQPKPAPVRKPPPPLISSGKEIKKPAGKEKKPMDPSTKKLEKQKKKDEARRKKEAKKKAKKGDSKKK